MTVALFRSVLKTQEGETVWGSLKQKVAEAVEAPAHIAEGWFADAKEALADHEIATMENDNEKLAAQIESAQLKLDGRTKAAKDLKAKSVPNVPVETDPSQTTSSTSAAQDSQNSASMPSDLPTDTPAT